MSWSGLGLSGNEQLYAELCTRYREPHRAYHTLNHISECFAKLDEARHLAVRLPEVELAIWFHDAIYDPRRSDNEMQSALWAKQSLEAAGADREVAQRVHDLILITRHNSVVTTPDAALLSDIDLSILGAAQDRFDQYELQVRREYSHVPTFMFRMARRRILKEFLRRPQIYVTDWFHNRYEAQARRNLQRSIRALSWWRW